MSYDVVIAGAGSAGCVLAARLSEDPARSVLLLEAGPDYPDLASLPPEIASSYAAAYTHDWGYASEPGLLGRTIALRRAKLVGGCSATNAALALRGTAQDYDGWSLLGNPGWSFAEVLPFFRRLESDADFDDDWHGREGPLPIRRYPAGDLTPVQGAFLEACTAGGYPRVDDHNAPGAMGSGPAPMNTVGGIRQSAALAYLGPARHRANLAVRSGVLVDRVLFEGRRAVGVRLAGSGEVIYADQVILAAGSYGSPAILMRSGIGPAEHLKALGIPVKVDLPGVGANLTDHSLFGLHFAAPPAALAEEPIIFFQTILTLKSSLSANTHDLHVVPCSAYPVGLEQSPTGFVYLLLVSVVKPFSRGLLRLRSPDPSAAPVIDPGYFRHPDDMVRMIEAVRAARQLSRTPPLSEWTRQELYPGPQVTDSADLEAAVVAQVDTYHHPVSTCRMGKDTTAVVDARGNVYGVENLSVIDASIMPAIPGANTNLPTIMLAERCAVWLTGASVQPSAKTS